jgi:hypothetical protein
MDDVVEVRNGCSETQVWLVSEYILTERYTVIKD